jgi:hypothetical protein
VIVAGAPICTVHAKGESMRAARQLVLARREQIQAESSLRAA